MASIQTLSETDRRLLASWAADCAEQVLPLFEAEAPEDARSREAIARARAFSRGELDAAGEIRRRLIAVRAADAVTSPAAAAAARAAAQAAAVAHMGAHALGAAAYAATATWHADHQQPGSLSSAVDWQLDRLTTPMQAALKRLPPLGQDSAGPLGRGLLSTGALADVIRRIQTGVGCAAS